MQEHQWIVSVCTDLAEYARQNGLLEIERAAENAARAASREIKFAAWFDSEEAFERPSLVLWGRVTDRSQTDANLRKRVQRFNLAAGRADEETVVPFRLGR